MFKFKVGQTVNYKGELVEILEAIKGNKSKKPNFQGGILTGFKSNPPLYTLSNKQKVRGDKIKPVINI